MSKPKVYEEVIAEVLQELDAQYATYQALHEKFRGHEDINAKHVYSTLVDLCKKIRKEITLRERK